MDVQDLALTVQGFSDVELAMLLSLIAKESCLIHTDQGALDALEEEVKLIAADVFGLSSASIHCTDSTTLEDFTRSILIDKTSVQGPETPQLQGRRASSYKFERSYSGDRYQIAPVFIAKNLSSSPHQIQMQALELLRTRRIFTHTGVYSAPKHFLMVILNSTGAVPLSKHINDFIFISHIHDSNDGFPNIEESSEWIEDDKASTSSVVRKMSVKTPSVGALLPAHDIENLSKLSEVVTISTDVKRYLHDLVTFLRFHRAVATGVSPRATKHMELLVRCLAPLHGLDFVTPSLVMLAARKIYGHRVSLNSPEEERSMQYGSESTAVANLIADMTVDSVIEDAIMEVDVPL